MADEKEEPKIAHAELIIAGVIFASAVLLGLTFYFGNQGLEQVKTSNSINAELKKANQEIPQIPPAPAKPPENEVGGVPKKEVFLEFLYAEWCGHCQKMKPIVEKLDNEFPDDRFEVRYLDEQDRASNEEVAKIYEKYEKKGYFRGFPTFVINGNSSTVGSKSEAAFRSWVCGHFLSPKPAGC